MLDLRILLHLFGGSVDDVGLGVILGQRVRLALGAGRAGLLLGAGSTLATSRSAGAGLVLATQLLEMLAVLLRKPLANLSRAVNE